MRIVICNAGLGSRLGFDIPKCLVEINGKSILERQLEILIQLTSNIVVVVGFKKEQIIEKAAKFNVEIACNDDYSTTSVVDSVKIGINGSTEEIVVVDGDVLFTQEDITSLLAMPGDVVCIKRKISNDSPVYVTTDSKNILTFRRSNPTDLEWAGICKVQSAYFDNTDKFIYKVLERHLPMPFVLIDSVEIDTPEDLLEAQTWMKR